MVCEGGELSGRAGGPTSGRRARSGIDVPRSDPIQSQTFRHLGAVPELRRAITAEHDKLVHRDHLAQVLLLDKNVDAATALIDEVLKKSPRDRPNSIAPQRAVALQPAK